MRPQTKYKPVVLTSFSGITGNSSFAIDSSEEASLSADKAESDSLDDCWSIPTCPRDVDGKAKAFDASDERRECLAAGVIGVVGSEKMHENAKLSRNKKILKRNKNM